MIKSALLIPFLLLFFSCEDRKQNFVFILVDDLGWADLGYSGSKFHETPNIDALSEESIQFTHAYASGSVCSPSRASIMTGLHPSRLNITDWLPGLDPLSEKLIGPKDEEQLALEHHTFAEVLQTHGYTTFFAGKWHLGGEGYLPENQGFQTNIGGYHLGRPAGGYYSPYKNLKLSDGPEGEYLTDRLTDESLDFLDNVGDKPFMLFLSYYTVHTPIQPNIKHIKKFKEKLLALEPQQSTYELEGRSVTTQLQRNAAYASMIYALDINIGRLVQQLKAKGLYENTTIIFTSDNGGLATLSASRKQKAPTSNYPLRAGKGWLYEGGIRVPLLIKPAHFDGNGWISSEKVVGADFYTTILSLAGINVISDFTLDGKDISSHLNNNNELSRDELFWHYPHYHGTGWTPGAAIISGDYKLIEFYDPVKTELYNISEDTSERRDLSLLMPIKTKALLKRLHELQEETKAKMPNVNPHYIKNP